MTVEFFLYEQPLLLKFAIKSEIQITSTGVCNHAFFSW